MKKKFISLMAAIFAMFALSCSTYKVLTQNPEKPSLKGKADIIVGYLDMKSMDWKEMGYDSKEEWDKEANYLSISGFQTYLKELLPGKKIVFENPNPKGLPKDGEIYIKLENVKIEKNYNHFTGFFLGISHDYIYVTAKFIDIKTKKELYTCTLKAMSTGSTIFHELGWHSRLNNMVYNFAKGLASRFES